MGFPDQQKSWPVPLIVDFLENYRYVPDIKPIGQKGLVYLFPNIVFFLNVICMSMFNLGQFCSFSITA